MNQDIDRLLNNLEAEDVNIFTPKDIILKLYKFINSINELKSIWVEGEVYNFKKNSQTGHIYFSLKDGEYTLDCTYFRHNQNYKIQNQIEIQNGKKILAYGNISLYKVNGKCQLNVEKISERNIKGSIYEKILKIYEKLKSEGLFDDGKKKKLPLLPINLGIATSDTGAAIRDIIKIAKNRFPMINIYIAPCLVQGDKAKESIINAIKLLNRPEYQIDVIIVGRGGGSFEDLLVFNEEEIVRAFANSRVPIVAAIGHQIDHPICEYAADKVAATPSNAAEICVPEIKTINETLLDWERKLNFALKKNLELKKYFLEQIMNHLVWKKPIEILLDDSYQKVEILENRLKKAIISQLEKKYYKLQIQEEKLKHLNPQAPLNRGYTFVTNQNNQIIKNAIDLKINENVKIHFASDMAIAEIKRIII